MTTEPSTLLGVPTAEAPARRYTVAVDFDGVLHSYTSPWEAADVIPDPPVAGAIEWLEEITKLYDVEIFTTRANTGLHGDAGIDAVLNWLMEHGYTFDRPVKVTAVKGPALIYIDDRAWRFHGPGSFPSPGLIRGFQPWNKRRGPSPEEKARRAKREHVRRNEWGLMQAKLSRLKAERIDLYCALIREILRGAGVDDDVAEEWLRQSEGQSWQARVAAARAVAASH